MSPYLEIRLLLCNKLRCGHAGEGWDLDTGLHTGRMPCEHKGRDQDDVWKSRGMPEIACRPPRARNRHGIDSSSSSSKEPNLPTPRSWTSSFQNCETIQFCCSMPPN